MKFEKYLLRIGFDNFEIEPNLLNLKQLQKQHLLNVPFENLDIHWNRQIVTDVGKFYRKIVENRRGGFCYELNGLFKELLDGIGYETKIVSARVSNGKGGFGKEYDHLAILAEIDTREYLVDVGFGDFIAEPLKLAIDAEQVDSNGVYLIRKFDKEYFEVLKKNGNDWQSEYIFNTVERGLSEFTEMCDFHQTSESHFSKGKVCSMKTINGRKTLTDKKFVESTDGEKREFEIKSGEEFSAILEREFNIKQ